MAARGWFSPTGRAVFCACVSPSPSKVLSLWVLGAILAWAYLWGARHDKDR
jgi:hypothetical protein